MRRYGISFEWGNSRFTINTSLAQVRSVRKNVPKEREPGTRSQSRSGCWGVDKNVHKLNPLAYSIPAETVKYSFIFIRVIERPAISSQEQIEGSHCRVAKVQPSGIVGSDPTWMFVCVLGAYYIESELKLLTKSVIWIACNWQNGLSSATPNYIWIIKNKKSSTQWRILL
jgi:hypothetical protein